MKIIKPLQTSILHKAFEINGRKKLAVTVLLATPFENSNPLLEPDLWKFVGCQIGAKEILDLGIPKPNGEVLIYGSYFAPKGSFVTADSVRLKIGSIDKSLLVYGERFWSAFLGSSKPEPFNTMPLDYTHALGGEGFDKNPIGKGMLEVNVNGEVRKPLPNIEHPDHVMSFSGQQPDPAGFGPLGMSWKFRASKLGTYDNKWLNELWPAYPNDINWNYFNTAPPDQWLSDFFNGGELFELYNMHPEKPVIKGQLPSYRVRSFIQREHTHDGHLEEVPMRMETVWLFPHAETSVVLYRGVIDIETDDATDVRNLIVGYENLRDTPRELTHYAIALDNRLDPAKSDLFMFNTTDLIPNGETCGYGATAIPESSSETDSESNDTTQTNDSNNPDELTLRDELNALSEKLAWIPGSEAAKAKVDEAIRALDLPPLFPRPLRHEQTNVLITSNQQAWQHRNTVSEFGDRNSAPAVSEFDVEIKGFEVEEAELEMKEGYRCQAHILEEGRPAHEKYLESLRLEFIERLKRKEYLAGVDLAGLDLSGLDLRGIDLSGCYLEKVNFADSNLSGANLQEVILPFADLTRCDLSGANLKKANLGSSNLTDANLDGADMEGAILGRSILWGAKLTNCNLADVDMLETDFADSDFSGSTMPNSQFIDLHMERVKFKNSQLTGSTFTNCNLDDSDFTEAILDEATWIGCWLDGANFEGASMINTRFPGGTSLRGAQFISTVLESSNLRDTDLSNADFTNSVLNMCDFSDAKALNAHFTRSIAKCAQFKGTDLGDSLLTSMNMMEGTLMKARLTGAKLCNSNCYGVEFMKATVGGTDFTGTMLDRTKLELWRPR